MFACLHDTHKLRIPSVALLNLLYVLLSITSDSLVVQQAPAQNPHCRPSCIFLFRAPISGLSSSIKYNGILTLLLLRCCQILWCCSEMARAGRIRYALLIWVIQEPLWYCKDVFINIFKRGLPTG